MKLLTVTLIEFITVHDALPCSYSREIPQSKFEDVVRLVYILYYKVQHT